MSKLLAALATVAALAAVSPAHAITFNFTAGSDLAGVGYAPQVGYTVVNDFNELGDLSVISSGSGFNLHPAGTDPNNAEPAFPSGGSPYLSVLGGGFATVNFLQPFGGSFQFDWGSIDTYNTLTIHRLVGGDFVVDPALFLPPANGNQSSSLTNGVFTVNGAGDTITGITLASSANSFEVDNFAVLTAGINPLEPGAIPEPATWAMMILGFGMAGGLLRRRRAALA